MITTYEDGGCLYDRRIMDSRNISILCGCTHEQAIQAIQKLKPVLHVCPLEVAIPLPNKEFIPGLLLENSYDVLMVLGYLAAPSANHLVELMSSLKELDRPELDDYLIEEGAHPDWVFPYQK